MPAITVTKENVTISVNPEESDHGLEGHEDNEGFVEAVNEMVDEHGLWGWCDVKVTAAFGTLEGHDYLGACSYKSVEDFVSNSGYYDDMVEEAIDALQRKINTVYSFIHVETPTNKRGTNVSQ